MLAVAHRGDPVGHRENTLPAVRAAVAAGADLVEVDVKTTADGVSVVLHDDSLARLWEVDRDVRTMTAQEVADAVAVAARRAGVVPVGACEPRVPLLEETLHAVAGTPSGLLIDLNSVGAAATAQATVERVVASGVVGGDQVAWCGHPEALRTVRAADPQARVFLSWGEEILGGLPPEGLLAELRPEAFNPHWGLVGPDVRSWADERGLALSCWTVDDAAALRAVLEQGVDAVISNRVELVVGAVRAWNAKGRS